MAALQGEELGVVRGGDFCGSGVGHDALEGYSLVAAFEYEE